MGELKELLKTHGWHISEEGLEICKEDFDQDKRKHPSVQEIIKQALNIDLSEIGLKVLHEDVNKGKLKELQGPLVLQVVKVRNASAPKANEESSVAPRMLQVHLTDGFKTCVGLEHTRVINLSLETPPGSKVCLRGEVQVRNGFLLLNDNNITILGGKVENIYKKWRAAKEASGFSRMLTDIDEAPPPFVQFGKKIPTNYNTTKPVMKSSFKQNEVEEGDKEFSEQRSAAIAEVKKNKSDTSGKTFSSGGNRPMPEVSGTPTHQRMERKFDRQKSFDNTQTANTTHYKSGNFKVDENVCAQIIQMGFSRTAACDALRQFGNNLNDAIEFLLSGSNKKADLREPSGSAGGKRGGYSRGGRYERKGRESNRGRNKDDADQRHASNATLFDFLETKMSSSSKNERSEPQDVPSTSKDCGAPRTSCSADDDALQEEYILEYVKELSLVETGGISVDQQSHQHRERPSNSNEEQEIDKGDPENRGVAKYRGKYTNERNKNYQRNNNKPRRENDRGFDLRNRKFNSRSEDANRVNANDHTDEKISGFSHSNKNQFSDVRRHDDQQRGKGARKTTNRNYKETDHYNSTQPQKIDNTNTPSSADAARSAGDHNWANGPSQTDVYSSSYRPEPGRQGKPFRKPYNDRNHEIPPRFQKKQMQEGYRPYQPPNQQKPQSNILQGNNKKGLTLGDTARQMKEESNLITSSSTTSSITEPFHPNFQPSMTTRQKPASHSYQDQRQQTRAYNCTDYPSYADKNNEQRANSISSINKFPWERGMTCQAKYWEDSQFYKAVIVDIHPTEPTAVVSFTDYGNCEEVLFKDLKLENDKVSHHVVDHGSYNGPVAGLEFTRGHKGPTRMPDRDRQRRSQQKPSRLLYQPPSGN